MALTFETVDALFRKGEFSELLREANFESGLDRSLDSTSRLTVAHALAIIGQFDAAWRIADPEAQSPAAHLRAKADYVLGIVSQARGDIDLASQHLRASIKSALDCREWEQLAWAQLSLFRLFTNTQGSETLAAALPDLRRTVARAGDARVSAYLHVCVASLEGQAGRFDEGLRHCDIADSLLSNSPNTWLTANVHLNRASIASLQCDFERSAYHIQAGRALALKSGDGKSVLMFDNNAAHVGTATGRFDEARRIYGRLLNAQGMSSFTRLGSLEGLARLELAVGDLDRCQSALDEIDRSVKATPALSLNFSVRWSAITKTRLLLARGDCSAALSWLKNLEARSRSIQDLPFTAALHLLTAKALAGAGDSPGAAQRLVAASSSEILRFRELQPEYYSGLASVLGDDSRLRQQLESRAGRVAANHGIAWPESSKFTGNEKVPYGPTTATQQLEIARFSDSVAGLVDLAFNPRLFVTELLELVSNVGCVGARIVVSRNETEDPEPSNEVARLSIGRERRHRLTLECPIPERASQAVLLADVLRIGRAALALERFRQEERNRAALWPADPVETEAGALFLAEEMQTLLATARRVASANVPVLITGETGTGKEVLARLIHAYSPRAKAAFLPFNCTATPKDMLDSQLFGHRRGSFTGAVDHFQGVIRAAAGGTLFLDEIGETTLDVQPKLLRFLESAEVHPIGETHPTRVDVRVIAATNANLDTLVAQGRFREDLFYRMNIVPLHVPPLRERRVEVPALANHYLRKFAHENHKGDLRLAEETIEFLVLYRWPGNVRQLANEMRRMAALAEASAVLMPEHLSPEIAASRRTVPASERALDPTEVVVRLDQPMLAGVSHLERTMIQYALKANGGRLEETAVMLGISRKGLYLKRQRYGLDSPFDEIAAEVA